MRKVAVISDIHANLEALEQVLRDLSGVDTYCLGDLVDYGADPNGVVELLRERKVPCVLGNHDAAVFTGDTSLFNPKAAMSSVWTAARLTRSNIEFLRSLPQEMKIRIGEVEVYFTHGSPDDNLWEYVDPRTHSDLFGHYLAKTKSQAMGLGHTHIQYVWNEDGRFVFNPGSVGQPRDGDRRAAYALVTVEGGEIVVDPKRVEYDFGRTAEKIRAAGLSDSFAARLATGT